MSTFNGLPIHALLVHFIVVLAPLTAVLAVLCVVWPAARQRLVWLVLGLALVTAGLTPLTTESGEWLEHHIDKSPLVEEHAELGDTMVYFALALLVAAILLTVQHVRAKRDRPFSAALSAAIAVFVLIAGVATSVQVFRIGHSGATSVWDDAVGATAAGDKDAD
ncbi:MAG TPA: hypothetical protein PLH92_16060 [Mycobacterium sp.]|uniref:DUF2231 domain-containing protein n=1 Tax=Mycolicibacterium sp. TaxID=2320850 RepID=UPI0025CD244B|nr:DUF2231 domain-containing protein [Mycolicibacterium sp.]HPX38196.1 hypothetical protein [Mycobacterium sp.]HQC78222.1 hypothetical protein [Mycobacterium sp.]